MVTALAALVLALCAMGKFWWHPLPPAHSLSEVKPSPAAALMPPSPPTATPKPALLEETNDFGLRSYALEKTPGSSLVYITGSIQNLSHRQRFGVKVAFDLYDTNEVPIGLATDYQSVIEPDAEWGFKALVMKSRVVSAKFHAITEDQ
jgi:hypothetical protein